jgi:hypothetical protein
MLGRFRLSFTTDAATLQTTSIRLDRKDSELVDLEVALGKAHAQRGQGDQAVAAFVLALALTRDRAGKARIIAEAAPLDGTLEKLAERAAGDAQFHADLARHFAERGNMPLANVQFDKARGLYERSLSERPENDQVATELAQLLFDAARATARAAAGQSKNEPRLDEATKASLRRQALDRLKAARTTLTRLRETGPRDTRLTVAKALIAWQQESDLAGVRDKAALAKLPAEEQKALTRFWADVAKSAEPASPAERIELARFCKMKKLYHTAAGLYASAFAAGPRLADDIGAGHRYNAACYAALAAAGQSVEAARIDDKERTRLRQQALDWLRADLAMRSKLLETGKAADRATVQRNMLHWQRDIDLAGARGAAALAKLPADEQAAWAQLWADVAALLKKAQEKPKSPR